MIRKLQIKFVAMCMTLVTAVLGVVFTAVFFSAKQNIEVISHQVLQRVMQDDTPQRPAGSGAQPGRGPDVLLPYFTVDLWDRSGIYEAFVTGGTYANLEDTQELQTILTDCLPAEPARGHYPQLRPAVSAPGLRTIRAHRLCGHVHGAGHHCRRSWAPICKSVWRRCCCFWASPSCWPGGPPARWQKAWQQQRQFLSDASHELKTPLTVILSNAELLEAAPLEDRPARWADNIRSEAGQMKSLVEEMLTLARADNAVPHGGDGGGLALRPGHGLRTGL